MYHATEIDSIGLRAEFNSAEEQRGWLNELLRYIRSINSVFVDQKQQNFGNGGLRVEHIVYSNNLQLGSIKSGVYNHGKDRKESTYYIKMVFAGLKSYDDYADELRQSFLLTVSSWLNRKKLRYTIAELDCDIDAHCHYNNFYVMQIKQVPNGNYSNEQIYSTTTYLQKKTKSTSALFYDKQIKESLENSMSRFELKLPTSFFKNKQDLQTLQTEIASVFGRYAVFYFEDLRFKDAVIRAENTIKYGVVYNKAREYAKLMSQINQYRLSPDIQHIINFIRVLYSVKNHKMVMDKKANNPYPIDTTNRVISAY